MNRPGSNDASEVVGRGARKQALVLDAPPPEPSGADELNVALYPYVPQPAWFQNVISTAWRASNPNVTLKWFTYDCYSAVPPDSLDVFAFDAIYAADFITEGYLLPFVGVGVDDFFDWAREGLETGDGRLYAAPYLGCMNVLIYRAGDWALSSPGLTNAGLAKILGTSQNVGAEPAPGDGLIVDFMGGTTDACLYLQTIMENSGNYGLPTLGPASKPDPAALRDLTSLVAMAGSKQATYCDAAEQRLLWFAGASGRALVGLTETLGALALDQVGAFAFRPLPVSDLAITKIPTFTDALAINASIDPAKTDIATAFVNLATGYGPQIRSLAPPSGDDTPQYLIPARSSVLTQLAKAFDPYKQIQDFFADFPPQAFRVGVGARDWLEQQAAGFRAEFIDSWNTCTPPPDPAFASSPAGIWRRGWS